MIQRFHFQTILSSLIQTPRWLGENPFVGFLTLLCVALLISSLIFYRYVFVARSEDVADEIIQTRFDQREFQQVIQTWQERQEKFDQAGKIQVRDIFAKPVEIFEEPEI